MDDVPVFPDDFDPCGIYKLESPSGEVSIPPEENSNMDDIFPFTGRRLDNFGRNEQFYY
jgi:hypothetical protein